MDMQLIVQKSHLRTKDSEIRCQVQIVQYAGVCRKCTPSRAVDVEENRRFSR